MLSKLGGAFIVFEGPDGSGKTTQCKLLEDTLKATGQIVTSVREPGGTPLGQQLRTILLGKNFQMGTRAELLLFMAARTELVETVIRPALQRGEIVLADRFYLSSIVYQGYAGSVPLGDVHQLCNFAVEETQPNLTFIFDVPVEVANLRRRRETDRMEDKGREYHNKVRAGYFTESRQPNRVLIDGTFEMKTIHHRIRTTVVRMLEEQEEGWARDQSY